MKVTTYKTIDIYLNDKEGIFYCNLTNSSKEFRKKSLHSSDLKKLKKGIDNAEGSVEKGTYVYYFSTYLGFIKKEVISIVGELYHFKDGTRSQNYQYSQTIYPKSIETTEAFQNIQKNAKEYNKIQVQLDELRKSLNKLSQENGMIVQSLKKDLL